MERMSIGPLVRRLDNLIGRTIGQARESIGLTATQGFVLGYLARHEGQPLCLRDLEAQFDLTHPTVSGILSRLEAGGYLELRADEHDRRYRRIFLLPKGAEAHRHMAVAIGHMEERMVSGMTPEDRQRLCGLLTLAIENLNFQPVKEEEHD